MIEDEDQMPFMQGYLMSSDEESDYDLDSSSSSYNWNSDRDCSSARTEVDDVDLEERKIIEDTDNSLNILLNIHEFKEESEVSEHIDKIINEVPIKREYTNNIFLRVLYRIIQYFRGRFESMFTIWETEFQHSKFFSDDMYK